MRVSVRNAAYDGKYWLGSVAIQTRHFDAALINGSAARARSPARRVPYYQSYLYHTVCALTHRHSHKHTRAYSWPFVFISRPLLNRVTRKRLVVKSGRLALQWPPHLAPHSAIAIARSVNVCDARVTPNVISFVRWASKRLRWWWISREFFWYMLARNVRCVWAHEQCLCHSCAIMKLSSRWFENDFKFATFYCFMIPANFLCSKPRLLIKKVF